MSIISEIEQLMQNDNDGIDELTIDMIMSAGKSVDKGITEDDVDPEELSMGVHVEMEHTSHKDISKKIALDHLSEIPDYYTRLRKMEEEAGVDVNERYKY